MIGRENIEEKIFQYFEGELSANESLELESFIKNNPEYQVDFDAWENSVVQDENIKYKFVDELLVKERFSPKVLFKWASGGALFFGLLASSVILINKFNGEEGRLNDLETKRNGLSIKNDGFLTENNHYETLKDNEKLVLSNTNGNQFNKNIKKDIKSADNDIYSVLNTDDINEIKPELKNKLIIVNKIQSNSDLSTNTNFNKKSIKTKAYNNYDDFPDKKSVLTLVNDKNQTKKNVRLDNIHIKSIKLKKYIHSKASPIINESKYTYENPNKPKLFVTNNKDPYLNYALAHTIEENGSFVGNFNDGKGIRAEMLYRTEWPSVTSENFTSKIFSLDTRLDALNGGVGMLINVDGIGHGKLNSTAVSLIYSPKFIIKNISIEPSFKYTYNQKSVSWNQVEENDVKDPRNGILYASIPFTPDNVLKTNIVHHDLGLGILINADKIYIGGQIDHLNKASYSHEYFDQEIIVPFKTSAMIGTDIMKNRKSQIRFSPSLNYIQYGVYNALWVNSQILYHGFFFSGGLATNEEIMASLGYSNNKVRLVYGLGFSKPREFSGLPLTGEYYESHQLSLRVNLQSKK